jgi:hypothetical protein
MQHAGYSNTIDRVGYNGPGQRFKKLFWGICIIIFIQGDRMGYLQLNLIKQLLKE